MQAVVFYLVYPILYGLALLPFRVLYVLSDIFAALFWLSGYRKDVVVTNLKNSFPEKSEKEIKQLARGYYSYLCDLILETLKTLTMSEQEARERCVFHRQEWLEKLHAEKRSVMLVLGHHGNWEWAGPAFTLGTPYQLNVIYRPLSNPYFEKMMTRMRTKFGTRITPAAQTLREMVATRQETVAFAFIADQAATTANSYWTTFLHQDTAVFNGPEKLAVKFNYPVVFIKLRRLKRGYYDMTPELLFADPKTTHDGEILEAFTRRLEVEIKQDPVIWLWSHKRWKHKRPAKTVE